MGQLANKSSRADQAMSTGERQTTAPSNTHRASQERLMLHIDMAKQLGADGPRQAAEFTVGQRLTDAEWAQYREVWERHWY